MDVWSGEMRRRFGQAKSVFTIDLDDDYLVRTVGGTHEVKSSAAMPNQQLRYAKMEAQLEYVYTLHTCFCMFGADLYAQSVLINKVSASELSRKLIKSALLVGYKCYSTIPIWLVEQNNLGVCPYG